MMMTLKCDLTLSLCSRVIGSAHRLTERNIWVKFNENAQRVQDMEQTRNSRHDL